MLTVGDRKSGAEVLDLNGSYRDWFATNKVSHVLVRPDYYVAGTAKDEAGLRAMFDRVLSSDLVK